MEWWLALCLILFSIIWFTSGVFIGPADYVPPLCTVFTHLHHGCRYWQLIPFMCVLTLNLVLVMMLIYSMTGSMTIVITFGVAWIVFCIELFRLRPPDDIDGSFDWIHTAISVMIYACIILTIALLTSPTIACIIVAGQVVLELMRIRDGRMHSRLIGISQHAYLLLFIITFIIKIEQGGFKKRIK